MAIVRCNETFQMNGRVTVQVGSLYDDESDIVQGYPAFFSPIDTDLSGRLVVEAATAAPGERRRTRRLQPPPQDAPESPDDLGDTSPVEGGGTETPGTDDRPSRGASTDAWFQWATANGFEVTAEMSRSEIIDQVELEEG